MGRLGAIAGRARSHRGFVVVGVVERILGLGWLGGPLAGRARSHRGFVVVGVVEKVLGLGWLGGPFVGGFWSRRRRCNTEISWATEIPVGAGSTRDGVAAVCINL